MRVIHTYLVKLIAVVTTTMLLFAFSIDANEDEPTVKALFIYNFTKHIEWPKGKINGRFVIGVMGSSPVFDKLTFILKDRKIKDLPADIRRVTNSSQAENCDLLFIANAESDHLKEINEKSDCYGLLIITEAKDMAKKGSCINIIRQDDRLKFEINDIAIKKEGLKISNQLYELAVIVK